MRRPRPHGPVVMVLRRTVRTVIRAMRTYGATRPRPGMMVAVAGPMTLIVARTIVVAVAGPVIIARPMIIVSGTVMVAAVARPVVIVARPVVAAAVVVRRAPLSVIPGTGRRLLRARRFATTLIASTGLGDRAYKCPAQQQYPYSSEKSFHMCRFLHLRYKNNPKVYPVHI